MSAATWYLRTQDDLFGPETKERLIEWARLGRIQPGQEVSPDGENWRPATEVPFLDMRWSIDIGDGTPRGPFNKFAAEALLRSGRLPKCSRLVEVAPATEAAPEMEAAPEEEIAPEKPEAPENPAKDREELERRLAEAQERVRKAEADAVEARRRAEEAQERIKSAEADATAAKRSAEEAFARAKDSESRAETAEARVKDSESRVETAEARAKDSESRTAKAEEKIADMKAEMSRLPPNARVAAEAEAAIYGLMSAESEELAEMLEFEKRDFEEKRRACQKRFDRLLSRRQELLRRIGTGAEDMVRRALKEHPEDPRTVQSRREMDEMKLAQEQAMREKEQTIQDLTHKYAEAKAEADRLRSQLTDVTTLNNQIQELRERLQLREHELLTERQRAEQIRQRDDAAQQALLARLAQLESTLPGGTMQSREARKVKIAPWMGFKK